MSYHQVLRRDQDGVDTLTRLWRPVCGILFPLACLLIIVTGCIAILREISIADATLPLIGILVPVMTLWAGVIGYYVKARTDEKKAWVS